MIVAHRWWAATVAAGAVAGAACAATEGETTPADSAAVRVVNVEVERLAYGDFTDWIRITGEVAAMHDVTLAAEEGGRVERFPVAKGRAVAAGQVIAELDDDVLRAQVEEARAQADLAREQHERQRRLWVEEGLGTELAWLQAKSQAEASAARLATLEARLARMTIRSPVAGVFDQKFVEAGEMAMPGSRIARVVSITRVKVTGGIPERDALAAQRGDSARIVFDVLPGREFVGRIDYVGASVDAANRTVPIEVVMRNPGGVVRPRMIANVQVVRARLDSVLVVPQEVVRRIEDGYQVLVAVERNGHAVAEARKVTLGPAYRNRVVITGGLAAGDRVITVGANLVDHGSRIRIVRDAPERVELTPGREGA